MIREHLRLLLIQEISKLVTEWNNRPLSGEGSDRSDLISKLTDAIIVDMNSNPNECLEVIKDKS
jgi:hypothetical protein